MTKLRELPQTSSGASTATVDLVARGHLLLVGLAEAYDLRLSQPTIRGIAIPLSMKCRVIGDPMLYKKKDNINAGE
jgi:hypothetical protein